MSPKDNTPIPRSRWAVGGMQEGRCDGMKAVFTRNVYPYQYYDYYNSMVYFLIPFLPQQHNSAPPYQPAQGS
jgi:hypothetical protein